MAVGNSQGVRKSVLLLHLIAVGAVFGGDLALVSLGLAALGGMDPVMIYPAAHAVVQRLLLPGALLTLATGLGLGIVTSWGLFKHGWVVAKLVITVALSAAITFILLPGLEAAAAAASDGAASRNPLLVGPVAATMLLFVAMALGVFKPVRSRQARMIPGRA
jgi:hypothetical protein